MGRNDVDLVGQVIGQRYRILQKLGSGGMGSVWRVQHLQSLQTFALKTIRVTDDFPRAAAQRCLREARAAAKLRSRYIVRLTDVDSNYLHDGQPLPYLVMELLAGHDFEHVLMRLGRLGVEQMLWVLQQVCRGVYAAHEQGVFHRDLKPANLFLTQDDDGLPVVKVCDFGLAKVADAGANLFADLSTTQTGTLVGTPRYMSPEQLRGLPGSHNRIDQWAIGLIAFKLLSGKDYFDRSLNATDLSLRIIHDDLPPPSRCSGAVPRAFDNWFLRSCKRDPALRFASVLAQYQALYAAFAPCTPVSLQPSVVFSRTAQRNAKSLADTDAPTAASRAPPRLEQASPWAVAASVLATGACIFAAGSWIGHVHRHRSSSTTIHSVLGPEQNAALSSITPTVTERSELKQTPSANLATEAITAQSAAPRGTVTRTRPARVRASKTTNLLTAPEKPELTAVPSSLPTLGGGAACQRSSQCASQLCLAERCR